MNKNGLTTTVLKFNQYKEVSFFRIELSLVLKLHEIYKKYGLRLTYKAKHGELYNEDKLIFRAGCIKNLVKILYNYSELYNEAHNKLFNRIEDLSPNLIKIKIKVRR